MQKVIQRLTTMLTMLGLVCVSLVSFTACSDDDMQPSAIDEKYGIWMAIKTKAILPVIIFYVLQRKVVGWY